MASPFALRHFHLFSAAASLWLCQCVSKAPEPKPLPVDDSYWLQEPVSGPIKVVISLDEQRVAVLKNDKLIGLSPISSGREGYDTRPGVFKVTEKDIDHRSSWYGAFVDDNQTIVIEDVDVRKDKAPPGTKFMGAEMRYFMRFNGPIGLHQGYLPGYPASHGCIRVPAHMAHLLYEVTPPGSIVEVKQNAGLIAMRPAGAPSVLTQQALDSSIAPPAPLPTMAITPPPAEIASLEIKGEDQPNFFSRLIPEQKIKPTEPEAPKLSVRPETHAADATVATPPATPEEPKRNWFAAKPSASSADATVASTPPKPEEPKRSWFAAKPRASSADATVASTPPKPEEPKRRWFAAKPSASTADATVASTPPKPEEPKRSWFAAKPSASSADATVASTPPKPEEPKLKLAPAVASPAPLAVTPTPSRFAPVQRKPVRPTSLRPISPNVPGAPPVRMTLAPRTEYLPGYGR